ncbi:hypothetical protein B0H14DRAFT_2840790 [Mycena olivaceomarginata]|nr:hypothetical protein B0H14DRAFT_2840790 [Mycena olivaceomarginata]
MSGEDKESLTVIANLYGGTGGVGGVGGITGGAAGIGEGATMNINRAQNLTNNIVNQGHMNIHHLTPPPMVPGEQTEMSAENAAGGDTAMYTDSGCYSSQLLRRGRGFPLYVPGPQPNLPPEYQRIGVAIGDVCRLTPEGILEFFFNIYLPPNHPINVGNVPDGFSPLEPYGSRDMLSLEFPAGNHVSSPSVQKQDIQPSSNELPGVEYVFHCKAPQGAVLALPHGSHFKKLGRIERMRRYAANNAERWYKYLNDDRECGLANGALYLITGVEKSRSWGIAGFQHVTMQTEFPLSFTPAIRDAYHWALSGPATTKAWGSVTIRDEPLNQTVFVHGLSISLGTGIWGRLVKGIEVCQIVDSHLGHTSREFVPSASQGILSSWLLGLLGGRGQQEKQGAGGSKNPNDVAVCEFPPASPVFHPSQVINEYLLTKFPNATVVMSHDDAWRDILRSDNEASTVLTNFDLLRQICNQCLVIEEEGGTMFLSKKKTDTDNLPNIQSQEWNAFDAFDTPSESYCRQLMRQHRGHPLYVPGPPVNLPAAYRREGVAIGDVGRITPEGEFDFFFNIYLDADDPVHASRVPEGFSPLKRYVSSDVFHLDFDPGHYVSTHSVQQCPSSGKFPGSDFEFNCNSPRGAVLALPHGSHLQKLENIEPMRQYAAEHAKSWYRYVNGPRGRGLTNGALCLVTGVEKSRSWGIASFHGIIEETTFQILFRSTADNRYRWTRSGFAATKASGPVPIDGEPLNQTLFIHGLSISLGTGIWGELFGVVEVRDLQLTSRNEPVPFASRGFFPSWMSGWVGGGGKDPKAVGRNRQA